MGKEIFDRIEAELAALTIDEIKERIQPLTKGISITSPIFDPGTFLFRARRVDEKFSPQITIKKNDLIYPPKDISKLGRLNRAGEQRFYCSMNKESVFFELQNLAKGNEIILTFWKTTERLLVNNIGYTDFVFQQLGAKRPVPKWDSKTAEPSNPHQTAALAEWPKEIRDVALSKEKNREIQEILSRYFMHTVGNSELDRYKLTAAIGEVHLGKINNSSHQFAGLLYPSVRMWANGDNLALLPWFVDKHLEFRKAVHIRVENSENKKFDITYLNSASSFDESGHLIWLGRLPNWTIEPGQHCRATVVKGPDEDGDYSADKNGEPCHWVIEDTVTGKRIDPH